VKTRKRAGASFPFSRVPVFSPSIVCSLIAVVLLTRAFAQSEPPHPILTISGSGSGADSVLSGWTEAQYTNAFVPHQSPRNDDYGFVPAVVSGDTGWSWSPSAPNQITSTPSGIIFPGAPGYTNYFQAVTVLSGHTVQAPYYLRAGSTTSKSLVFALIDYKKLGQLRSDLNKLAPAYMNSGATHATRNQNYARRIAISLLDWARWFPDYYMTEKNSASFISVTPSYILPADKQRASDHNGLAHEWSDDELLAFDAIYDSPALTNLSVELGFDVRSYIKTNLFCNEGDFIVYHVPVDVATDSNLSGPYTVLALVARVFNRPDYILWMDSYLNTTVREKIRRDGALSEGMGYSIGYINENLGAAKNTRDYFLSRPADTPQLQSISNRVGSYVTTLSYGQSQWSLIALPNGQLPSFGDTPFNNYFSARNTGLSALMPAYGTVSMGAGSGSQAVQLNQNFSGDNNHMRSDTTAYTLWAFNNEYLGNIRYHNGTAGRQFTEQILAYNAVTIDRSDMSSPSANTSGNGDLTLYEAGNNGLAITEIDGQRAYANKASRYQRIMMLNTLDAAKPYAVDVMRVTGGTTHDYVFHGSIRYDQTYQCSFPLVTNTAPYPMLEGSEVWVEPTTSGSSFPYYGFWRNVNSNQAPGNFQITYRDTSTSHRDTRLWMMDDGTAQVYIGRTPVPARANGEPANYWVNNLWRPSSIIRKRISSGTLQDLFVSVIEPMNNGVSVIQNVERLPMNGGSLESVALRITFTDGRVDTCVVNLRNPQVAGANTGSATVSTVDGQYSLTGRIGVHADRPSSPRVWTINASDFQYAGRRLSTPTNIYFSGLIAGETRKLVGGSNDAFYTASPLPVGTALRNRQLSVTFGALSGSGTTGISEMFRIDQVLLTNSQYHIVFTNDPMLEITNSTISVEQMAPLRTFTGSNAYEIVLSASAQQISPISDAHIPPGGSSGPINFTFGNLGNTSGASLSVLASSANQALVPNGNLALGGSGTNRTLIITPLAGQTGVSAITIAVTDGSWTNSRTFNAIVTDFALSAMPASQTVLVGGGTSYSVSVTATNGFTNTVALMVTGVPPGASASFSPPAFNGPGSSTLNVTTSNSISPGSFPLTLSAVSGSLTSSTTVTLIVTNVVASPGTMIWTGTNNWSSIFNWTNVSTGGFGPPGVANDVVFANLGAVPGSNTINSIVDADATINSLVFTNTSGNHTLLIAPGRTLLITGVAPGFANSPAINVGLETYTVADQVVHAAVTGVDGTLAISNSSACVQIRQGFGSGTVGTLAALDLSGLGTFNADMRRLQVGVESGVPRRVGGSLYLARTNTIVLNQALDVNTTNLTSGTPSLYFGHNTQVGNSNGPTIYLGIQNDIFVNHIVAGRGNQLGNLMAFNPAFLASHPSATFRASDGSGRVGQWVVGDNSAGSSTAPSSGTNDFTGGTVDALVDRLFLGRGRNGTTVNTGYGTLTFDAGTFDVNTLRLGTMVDESSSTNASGVGTLNINGSAALVVNSVLEFAHVNTTALAAAAAIAGTRGTLNLNGGTVQAANILGAGGTGTLNLNQGTLDVQNGSIANLTALNIGAADTSTAALLTNASTIHVLTPILVASNGVIAGNSVITAPALTLYGALAPGGDDIGVMTNNGVTIAGAGGRYVVGIRDAVGQPGGAWDLFAAAGGMQVQADNTNPFVVELQSLTDTGFGPAANFDPDNDYNWVIAAVSGVVTNFEPTKLSVNNTAFVNDLAGGYFRVATNDNSLVLVFAPNHPPAAAVCSFYGAPGAGRRIAMSALMPYWTDPDADPIAFVSINSSSTNGANNVSADSTFIYYTNVNSGMDAILYSVTDIRTNPPVAYRPGDSTRTAVGVIQILPPPVFAAAGPLGNEIVLNGKGGIPGSSCVILSTTNLNVPLAQWTRRATNVFDGNGNFSLTNTPAGSQEFYLLELP
jgi:hypothetical protein